MGPALTETQEGAADEKSHEGEETQEGAAGKASDGSAAGGAEQRSSSPQHADKQVWGSSSIKQEPDRPSGERELGYPSPCEISHRSSGKQGFS